MNKGITGDKKPSGIGKNWGGGGLTIVLWLTDEGNGEKIVAANVTSRGRGKKKLNYEGGAGGNSNSLRARVV